MFPVTDQDEPFPKIVIKYAGNEMFPVYVYAEGVGADTMANGPVTPETPDARVDNVLNGNSKEPFSA